MNLTMGPVSIAMLNSAFRIATAAVLMPCVPLLEKLVFFLIKDTDGKHAPNLVDRLDERLIEHPAVAIAQCREALNDMAYKAKKTSLVPSSCYIIIVKADIPSCRRKKKKSTIMRTSSGHIL